MSDIVLDSSQASEALRHHAHKSLAANALGVTAGIALRLFMLRVLIRLARTPPGELH